MKKRRVVLGLLGTTLDAGRGPARWERWRPSVALGQHEDLLVDRFDLLHSRRDAALAEQVAADVRTVSPETAVVRHEVGIGNPWDLEEVYGALHDFAKTYPFDQDREEYLVHITTGSHVAQICLFLLTEARYLPGRLLQTAPPPRRTSGAPGTYTVIDLDLSRYDRLATRFVREHGEATSFLKSGIATRSRAFNELIDRIERVAVASKAPLLLTGPTGAGKSQLARKIYELKKSRHLLSGPFVEVNCATVRGDGAMSALFGHAKGAFTGAVHERPGLLRAADHGLLFLDEIGELGQDEQAMLLRALEEKRFLPLGADREVKSDFQLLAGTNRELHREVLAGRFREDLFARINLWTFRLPGLAERREDLAPNLDYELSRAADAQNLRVTMTREAREAFLAFAESPSALWKANFRDFNAAVTRMATLAPAGRIGLAEAREEIARLRAAWDDGCASPGAESDEVSRLLGNAASDLDRFERAQLADVLRVCRAARSLSDAGRVLFAASRSRRATTNDADRLRKYLTRFGLSFRDVSTVPDNP